MHIATSVFLLASLFLIPSTLAKEQYSNSKMVCLVNKERTRYGLKPLNLNQVLTKAAQSHCEYQARSHKMSHTGAGGSNPGQRVTQAGYQWRSVGENVAYGYDTMASVMKTWMNSPGHRANILNKSYTCMGSAVAYAGNTPYYTQDFAAGGSSSGQNAPKCDGSDSSYNGSGGGDMGAQAYGSPGGNDYGSQGGDMGDQGGNDYGSQGGDMGDQGGNDYGSQGGDMGGQGGNDYGSQGDMGGQGGQGGHKHHKKHHGQEDSNDTQGGNDYGGQGGQEGAHGGKKPCKKGKGGHHGEQGDHDSRGGQHGNQSYGGKQGNSNSQY